MVVLYVHLAPDMYVCIQSHHPLVNVVLVLEGVPMQGWPPTSSRTMSTSTLAPWTSVPTTTSHRS